MNCRELFIVFFYNIADYMFKSEKTAGFRFRLLLDIEDFIKVEPLSYGPKPKEFLF